MCVLLLIYGNPWNGYIETSLNAMRFLTCETSQTFKNKMLSHLNDSKNDFKVMIASYYIQISGMPFPSASFGLDRIECYLNYSTKALYIKYKWKCRKCLWNRKCFCDICISDLIVYKKIRIMFENLSIWKWTIHTKTAKCWINCGIYFVPYLCDIWYKWNLWKRF